MRGMFIMLGSCVGGWAGWALGEELSDGLGIPFVLSSIGTIAGIIVGWWLHRRIFDD